MKRSLMLAAIVLGGALGAAAFAQGPAPGTGIAVPTAVDANGYKYWTPNSTLMTNRTTESQIRGIVVNILRSGNGLTENRIVFDNFYNLYIFPKLTLTTDEALAILPQERFKFFRDHLEICAHADARTVHEHLADLALTQMQQVVKDNFHPVVRYNAMLLIASLNDQDPVRVGAAREIPKPMQRALPVLLAEFDRPENTDAIRAAALIGLVRHLEWDSFNATQPLAPPQKAAAVKALLSLATQKTPPAGRNAGGHEWFRRRAIEGLAHAGYNKVEPAVATAMDAMLKDDAESVPIRCAVAAAIGKMTYQAPAVLAAQPTALEMGRLAVVACDQELTRVANMKKLEEERASRLAGDLGNQPGLGLGGGEGTRRPPGGMPVRPPAGGGEGILGLGGQDLLAEDPKQYRVDYVRRKIRAQLDAIQTGLVPRDANDKVRGVKNAAKIPADATYVSDVKNDVDALAKAIESAEGKDLASLEIELRLLMKPLETKTRKAGAAPAPAPADVPGDLPAPVGPAPMPPVAAPPAPVPPPVPAPAG
ncbi:MAG: hypothetical protein SFU86_09045 [Pirellulaceae bacterium]|nr:hypothetical protein [Pirellulaceae bacterium]